MKKTVSALLAFLMVLSLVLVVAPASTAMAEAAGDGSSETEYVLLLDSTYSNNANDEQNQRIAAAQLFIDLIPTDNAKLSIFAIGPKNGTFEGVEHYTLKKDKDGIDKDGYNTNTLARMQTIYQLVEGTSNLTMENRIAYKDLVADTFAEASQYASFSDEHCMIYAAMDYLLANEVKNACIVFFGAQKAASYRDYRVFGGENSMYAAISNYGDGEYANPQNSYLNIVKAHSGDAVPYKWSFNWIDVSDANHNDPTAKSFYIDLCENFNNGLYFDVTGDGYGSIPQAVLSIMNEYMAKADKQPAEKVTNSYTFNLTEAFSEVNIAFTGKGFNSIDIDYLDDTDGKVTFKKTDVSSLGKTQVWFNKQTDVDSGKFTYAVVKLILPQPGEYEFIFNSDESGQIEVQTITARDADISLTVNGGTQDLDFDSKGEDCNINIKFIYNETPISNQKYLATNCGVTTLHIVNNEKPENSKDVVIEEQYISGDGYVISFPSDVFGNEFREGTYEVYATVAQSKNFNVPRESEHVEVTFKNNAPVLEGEANITVDGYRPGETVPISEKLKVVYTDPDGEKNDKVTTTGLTFDSSASTLYGENPVINEDGTITLPKTKGTFVYTSGAVDNEGLEADKKVTITINVPNEVPQVNGDISDKQAKQDKARELYTGISDLLLKLGLFEAEEKVITVKVSDYFTDADNDAMTYYLTAADFMDATEEEPLLKAYVSDNKEFDAATATELTLKKDTAIAINGEYLHLIANKKGTDKVQILLHAEDITGNGYLDAEDDTYEFKIKVKSVWKELLDNYWPVLMVIGIILLIFIILLATRRVRGKWSVEIINNQNGQSIYQDIRSFAAATNRLRKYKVSVKDVANFVLRKHEVDDGDISTDTMSYKNPVLYGTILPGSCKMEVRPGRTLKVSIGSKEITKAGKIKIKPRQDIVLTYLDEYDNEALTVNLSFN